MTLPDATNSGNGARIETQPARPLDRDAGRNHNPIWAVRIEGGDHPLRVFACDDTQARRYVRDALGLIPVAVWLADD